MFRISLSFTRAITFALLTSTAFADVVVLKSGEKVEGKIVRESDQQVVMEVKVSAGITDERVIPKADVDRIDKVAPETEAYRAIITIQTANNSMASAQYDQPIRTLQAYLKQFPNSVHTEDAQKTLKEFLAEKQRVDAGEVKIHGQWLSKEEVEKEKVQIGGTITFEYMKAQSAAGDNIGALNTFVSLEKNYPGAATMPEAIELAKQLIAAIKPAVERAIPEQKILKANKEKGFLNGGPVERAEMIKAYKAEMDVAEANSAAAEKAGLWPPFIVTNEKCLKTLQGRVDKEATRLSTQPVDAMKKSVELANAAKKSIADKDFSAVADTLKEATTLWPKNELALRLTKVVADQKAADAKAAAEASKAKQETPAPKTTPAPKPKSTPVRPAATAQTAPADDDRSFFLTLPGAICIVVGIAAALAGFNVYKKMKARKESQDVHV